MLLLGSDLDVPNEQKRHSISGKTISVKNIISSQCFKLRAQLFKTNNVVS